MICGSCGRRRVDPNGSFCPKCGSSVFVAERQQTMFRAAVADAKSRLSTASGSGTATIRSVERVAETPSETLRSLQRAAETSSAKVQTLQRSARSLQRDAMRKATAAKRAAPALGLGKLMRFAIVVFVLWTAVNWLLEIPEIIALKDGIQHGQISDDDLRAAKEAVTGRLDAMLGRAPTPQVAPASRPTERPPAMARSTPIRSGASSPGVRPAPVTARVPAGVSLPGNGVSMPRVLSFELPRYTPETLRGLAEGTVVLDVVVRPHGDPGEVTVVASPHARFNADAIAAVRRWRFAPGQRAGQPIPVLVEIEIPLAAK